jgi:hypothetical protein
MATKGGKRSLVVSETQRLRQSASAFSLPLGLALIPDALNAVASLHDLALAATLVVF